MAALRRRRTATRSEGIDAFDAFYKVYITALVVGIVLVYAADAIGDSAVSATAVAEVKREGAAVLGLISAFVFAVGLRSGSRGGPLALETPEIHHVLLASVDRRRALAGPALRQAQFLAFVGVAVGGCAGLFANGRLPGGFAAWVGWTAAWAGLSVITGTALAWVASALRLHAAIATVAGAGLIALSAADIARATETWTDAPGWLRHTPTALFGEIGTFPLADHSGVWVPPLVALACVGAALARFHTVSLERLHLRSRLVGEMRFAATMRDLRTVIVLRRQLSQERPRSRPWFGIGTHRHLPWTSSEAGAVLRRGRRSLLRTPATRLGRLVFFMAAASTAAVGAYRGTTALVVVAGVCTFMAGLDATESLAEELDRAPIVSLAPVVRGRVLVLHLIVPTIVLVVLAAASVAAMAALGVAGADLAVAATVAAPAAIAGLAGAAVSVVRNDSMLGSGPAQETMVLPEVAGLGVVYQTALPPAIAVVGFVPVLAARNADDPAAAASGTAWLVVAVVGLVIAWIRYRDDFARFKTEAMEASSFGSARSTGDDDE